MSTAPWAQSSWQQKQRMHSCKFTSGLPAFIAIALGGQAHEGRYDRAEAVSGTQALGRPFPREVLIEERSEEDARQGIGSGLGEAPPEARAELAEAPLAAFAARFLKGAQGEELAVPEEGPHQEAGGDAAQEVYEYIYGSWLPASPYRLGGDFRFESIDDEIEREDYCEVELYLPIGAKE